jgi:hypothetical protein
MEFENKINFESEAEIRMKILGIGLAEIRMKFEKWAQFILAVELSFYTTDTPCMQGV